MHLWDVKWLLWTQYYVLWCKDYNSESWRRSFHYSFRERFSELIFLLHSSYGLQSHLKNWTNEYWTVAPRGKVCVCLSYIIILNSKSNSSYSFFLIFSRRKWGSKVLSDLPKATPLTGVRVGIQTLCLQSPSFLHYSALPPTSVWQLKQEDRILTCLTSTGNV